MSMYSTSFLSCLLLFVMCHFYNGKGWGNGPGVGGVDPLELELLLLDRTSLRALRLDDEEALPA